MSEIFPEYINNKNKISKDVPIYNKLYKLLDIKGINLFLYGYSIYKLHLLYNILNDKIPLVCTIYKNKDISYIKSNYHFEFDFINNKIAGFLIEILNNIFINNISTKYVIIKNFEILSESNKNKILYLLKKNKLSIIIIFNNYYYPLQNYGLFLKIPDNIKYTNNFINKSLMYNDIINKILDVYKTPINVSSIDKIKQLSNLLNNSVNFTIFLHNFLSKILEDNKITYKRKYKIINLFSDIQNKYIKSYYKIIYYEYIILNVYNICYL